MLDEIKNTAANYAMKIISHPTVTKFASHPLVIKVVGKSFEVHAQACSRVRDTVHTLVDLMPPSISKYLKKDYSSRQ